MIKSDKPLSIMDEEANRRYWTVEAMERYGGSFVKALANAFRNADHQNFSRLQLAFMELWGNYEGVGKELEKQIGKEDRDLA